MHRHEWGGFHYRIAGVDTDGKVNLEGGWGNNRRMGLHEQHRFVENIFEELDAPSEWYLDLAQGMFYFMPPPGVDLAKARIEVAGLKHLIEFRGTAQQPVRCITLKGLTFTHAARTFTETSEPLLRSDWTIYRGGAVRIEGAEDCAVDDCFFDQVGGNAIFVNHYNRRVAITRCKITEAGASGICFVGDPNAVRSPCFEYGQSVPLDQLDRVPGPKSLNYPAQCRVDDCLIHSLGQVEKQIAGVQISMAEEITVSHCSIYNLPRAGINIGDGCWGGHLIEFCDVFDTVKESGDHGSFSVDGKPATVVVPDKAAAGKPWIWYATFFEVMPGLDHALLTNGFHMVYLDMPDMLGCPEVIPPMNAFYRELTGRYGLAKKTALVGVSRGGLYCYNWAVANLDKVACIYGDAPVCDFKSWPGGKSKGRGNPPEWQRILQRYHFKSEAEALAYDKNPVDNLAPLAAAKIPLLHVYGEADIDVPPAENTGVIAERYRKLGGSMTLIPKPGIAHHPHGLEDPAPIIEFIKKCACSPLTSPEIR